MMLTNLLQVEIASIPVTVSKENVLRSVEYFLARHGISEPISSIKYIGGCSNHALKVTIETKDNIKKNVMVRLPGSSSELLINRHAENINTAIVAELGICPAFVKQFIEEGAVLQREGYKIEEFLENAEALTYKTFGQYRKKALAQLKIVHQCGKKFETQYNLLERIKLMCYSLQDVGGKEIKILTYQHGEKQVNLKEIISQVDYLEKLASAFGNIKLVPCHNDIAPFNFMKIPNENGGFDIKIIDWEYSGMNDPMVEIAYISNENGFHDRKAIAEMINDYYHDEIISENERQANIDRVLFYMPIIDLKVAVWSLMQVNMCNQSQYIEDLRSGWGPERYEKYIEKIASIEYKELISKLEMKLAQRVIYGSIFKPKIG